MTELRYHCCGVTPAGVAGGAVFILFGARHSLNSLVYPSKHTSNDVSACVIILKVLHRRQVVGTKQCAVSASRLDHIRKNKGSKVIDWKMTFDNRYISFDAPFMVCLLSSASHPQCMARGGVTVTSYKSDVGT
jgi:hypothetical protein